MVPVNDYLPEARPTVERQPRHHAAVVLSGICAAQARSAEQGGCQSRSFGSIIGKHAIPIYEELWSTITEYVKEAKSKSIPALTDGSLQDLIVRLYADSFHLILSKNKESISARGDRGIKFEFVLDVCPDGVVCLKFDNEKISIEEAAVKILDPFFFPELQGPLA